MTPQNHDHKEMKLICFIDLINVCFKLSDLSNDAPDSVDVVKEDCSLPWNTYI